jgi:hypothetical protein
MSILQYARLLCGDALDGFNLMDDLGIAREYGGAEITKVHGIRDALRPGDTVISPRL